MSSLDAETEHGPEYGQFDRIHQVMATCLDRMEREGPSAIEAICAEHQEIASELRRRLETLRSIGFLTQADDAAGDEFPERLGDFRLLQKLKGGGMGVVYAAEQVSLGRVVALKLIRPEQLYFPGSRERFQREAEAIARLRHPGIVPIYSVGEERGIPYFAMELVNGCSLTEVVRALSDREPERLREKDLTAILESKLEAGPGERPSGSPVPPRRGSWADACVRITRDLADALSHAHRLGVLHRDLKPSNVMITREGRVVLLDFGLAVLEGASRLTSAGSRVGSAPYMPPEQISGQPNEVDERSDVYSLGVTLYELLTLRLPFPQTNLQALRLSVVTGQAPPVRRLNPAVSWDVETVCRKAMDPDPARRYASAEAFSRDLTNILNQQPIEAARAGAALRLLRFCQRRPALAVTAMLGSILVVGVPLTYALVTERANRRIQAALTQRNAQFTRAERNLRRSMDAVERMLTRFSDRELAGLPRMERVRREVLEDARKIYEGLAGDQPDDPIVRLRIAQSTAKIAGLHVLLGEIDPGFSAYRHSLEAFGELLRETPLEPEARSGAAHVRAQLGLLSMRTGDFDAAESLLLEALSSWRQLDRELPENPGVTSGLIETSNALERFYLLTHRFDEALEQGQLALLEARSAAKRSGHAHDLALALGNLASVRLARGESKEAEDLFEETVMVTGRLLDHDPNDSTAISTRASTLLNLALLYQGDGRLTAAERALAQVLQEFGRQVEQQPERTDLREMLARAGIQMGEIHIDLQREIDAAADFREALEQARRLVLDAPELHSARTLLSNCLGSLADLEVRAGRVSEAAPLYREGIELLARLAEENPEDETHHSNQGQNLEGLAYVALASDRPGEQIELLQQALGCYRAAFDLAGTGSFAEQRYTDVAGRLVPLLLEARRANELFELAEQVAALHALDAEPLRAAAGILCQAAELDGEGAGRCHDRALEMLRAARNLDPELDLSDGTFDPIRDRL